jgi:hypothetical protein
MNAGNEINKKLDNFFDELKEMKKGIEKLKKSQTRRRNDSSSMTSDSNSSYGSFGSMTDWAATECDFCGRIGHSEVVCWKVRCDFCSKKGHTKQVCKAYETHLKIRLLEADLMNRDAPKDTNPTGNLKKRQPMNKEAVIKNEAEGNESGLNELQPEIVLVEKMKEIHVEEEGRNPIMKDDDNSEDEDLVKMRNSFKNQKNISEQLFREYKMYKDYENLEEILEDARIWNKNLKKAAAKEYEDSKYDKWKDLMRDIDFFIEEIKKERTRTLEKIKKTEKKKRK